MEILVILLLTLLNGFFSGAEIALLSVRKTRLTELASAGNKGAEAALKLRAAPESFLATVQVGITVVGSAAAAFGGSTLTAPLAEVLQRLGLGEASEGLALAIVVTAISIVSVVLGELVPKSISLRSSETISLVAARPLLILSRVARPLVWFLTAASNLILKPFRDETSFLEGKLSGDELQQLVEEAGESGSLHEDVSDIASRAIELGSIRVAGIMIPRTQIVGFKKKMTRADVWAVMKDRPHARYPLLSDDANSVEGYVTMRDLTIQLVDQEVIDFSKIAREAPHFPEQTAALDVLRAIQRERVPIGVVVNEYGDLSGIVTVDDIMEELVGEVLAEHQRPHTRIQTDGDFTFVVLADTPVHEVNRELDLDLPVDRSYATLAGLLIHQAGRILGVGDELLLEGNVRAKVREATARQIRVVELTKTQAD